MFLRSFSRRFSTGSSSSSGQDNDHQTKNKTNNIFKEEICFEDINDEDLGTWEMPRIPDAQLYQTEKHSFFSKSNHVIRTVEEVIALDDIEQTFQLLSNKSIRKHKEEESNFLHIGCVQASLKPTIRLGLNTSVLLCLRDARHNQFRDSLLRTVESSICAGPIYFNSFPDLTVSLKDKNISDVLTLNLAIFGLDMKSGSVPINLTYRVRYKVMMSMISRSLKPKQTGETTLFLTDTTKARVTVPKAIKWSEVSFPQKWTLDRVVPAKPIPTPEFQEIKQFETGKVELFFDRRNSFHLGSSSRSEISEDFKTAATAMSRRSFSTISQNDFPNIQLRGLDTSSSLPRPVYHKEDDDQKSIQSPTYSSINEPHEF